MAFVMFLISQIYPDRVVDVFAVRNIHIIQLKENACKTDLTELMDEIKNDLNAEAVFFNNRKCAIYIDLPDDAQLNKLKLETILKKHNISDYDLLR